MDQRMRSSAVMKEAVVEDDPITIPPLPAPPPLTCDSSVAPHINVSLPAVPPAGSTVTATATPSFLAGTGSINWGDGGSTPSVTSGAAVTHAYTRTAAPQSRTVTLTVASGNLSCPATATLTIPPLAPVTCADIN